MSRIITFIIGAIAGFAINKILELSTEAIKGRLKGVWLKINLKKVGNINEELNIETISSGIPYYDLENNIVIRDSKKKFFIEFPENKKNIMINVNNKFEFNTGISFDGECDYDDIVKQTGINNLKSLIEKYRNKVADDFIKKRNGCNFNGKKYGVYEIDVTNRIGIEEKPMVELKTFETDYFTHKVLREVYKKLAIKNHDISKVKDVNELRKYNVFNTSLGINGVVKVNSKEGINSFIITRRSKNINTEGNREWYASSFIEGVSQTDYDCDNNSVSLLKCIKRGMREELGIPQNGYYTDSSVKVCDFFLEKKFFEIGITCSITLDKKIEFERDVINLPAKDKPAEVAKVLTITNRNIKKFLKNNKDEIYSRSFYTINSINERERLERIHI